MPSTPKYTLHYFDARARGETARLLFALKGQKYCDNRIQFSDWSKLKPDSPTGQLPYLEINGEQLPESGAINRYLAREFGYNGKSSIQAAQIDAVMQIVDELFSGVKSMVLKKVLNDPEKGAAIKAEFDDNSTAILQKLEMTANKNTKGKGYFVGSNITVADVHFFSTVDIIGDHEEFTGFLGSYPALKIVMQKVKGQGNIKKYLKSRKQTPV